MDSDRNALRRRALAGLLGLELRRVRKQALRTVAGSAVLFPVLSLTGVVGAGTMPFLLMIAGFSLAFLTPIQVVKDKLEGTMEFLTTLPADMSTHVLARFLASSALAAASSAFFTAACAMVLPAMLGLSVARTVLVSYPALWMILTVLSCLTIALLTRFKLAQLQSAGAAISVIAVIALLWVLDTLFGDPLQLLVRALASESGRWILVSAALALSAAVLVGSFFLTRAAVHDYRPEPDAADW